MGLFRAEFMKIHIKQPIMFLFFILLIGTLIYGLVLKRDSIYTNLYVEDNKTQYLNLLSCVKGKWTENKEKKIVELELRYNNALKEMADCESDYVSGKMQQEEYINKSIELENILNQKDMIEILVSQNEYASKEPENRYFLYSNGWNNYFKNCDSTTLFVLFYILYGALYFGVEYETNMDIINRVTYKGKAVLYWSKIIQLIIGIIFFVAAQWSANVVVAMCRYGLEGFSYPLQSLSLYEHCTWNITIGEMLGITFLFLLVGSIYISVTTMFVSLFLKKITNTIIVSASLIMIPLFVFPDDILYAGPFPFAFSDIGGFVNGIWNESIGQYEFFSLEKMIYLLLGALLVSICMCVLGMYLYEGETPPRGRRIKNKLLFTMYVIILSCLLQGCQKSSLDCSDKVYNNTGWGLITVNDERVIYADGSSITIEQDDKKENLFKNPFYQEEENVSIVVNDITDDAAICIRTDEMTGDCEILSVAFNASQEEVLYEHQNFDLVGYNYLDIYQRDVNSYLVQQNDTILNCWIDNNVLYVVTSNNVYRIDSRGERQVLFSDTASEVVSYVNGKIAYINRQYRVSLYDVETGENTQITDYPSSACIMTKSYIFIQNMNGEIGKYSLETGDREIVWYTSGQLMHADEKYIYCSEVDNIVERINHVGNIFVEQIETENPVMVIKSQMDGSCYYIATDKEGKIEFVEGR